VRRARAAGGERQLIGNLVHNAVKYNHPGGRVDIDLSERDGLTIRNTGPVVPPEEVPAHFRPFRRLHHDPDGTGLGLAIVTAIARAHNASATAVANPEGGGLTVTIRFRGTR
jgi:signal transduction histidine kinase